MFLRFNKKTNRLMWMATLTPDDEDRVECGTFDREWQQKGLDDHIKGRAVMLIK